MCQIYTVNPCYLTQCKTFILEVTSLEPWDNFKDLGLIITNTKHK